MATTAGASSPTPRIRLNDSDHGAAVIIAAGIMLGTTVIALTLRLHQRWPWTRMLKLEDVMLLIATIFDIANVAAVALAVQYGLGQHSHSLTSHRIDKTRQALIASFTVSFLTEGFAAISSFALLRSMTPNKMYRRLMTGLVAVVAAWSLAGLLRFAVASSTGNLEIASWIGFGVVNMLIQLALFASAMWTIWPLQMAVSKKMGVSLWFSLCLPVAAVTAIRLAYIPRQTFGSDFTWKDTNMVIISLVESNLAIINAAYPSVRSFLTKVSTGFLVAETLKDSKSGSNGGSYGLKTIGRRSRSGGTRMTETGLSLGDRTIGQHTTTVRGDMKSDKSFGSEVIMVRRSVEVDEIPMSDS